MNLTPRSASLCAIYVVLHLAAQLSARWFEIAPGISVWYPPSGLALALIWLLGPRYSVLVFAVNVVGAMIMPGLPRWWAPLVFPALIAANYTAVAYLARRFVGENLLQGRIGGVVQFALVALCAPVGAATLGTVLSDISGLYHPDSVPTAILRWWLGDVGGILTIMPVAMVFAAPWLSGKSIARSREHRGWRLLVSSLGPLADQTSLPAVRDHRVHQVDGDLLFRPGPRLADGIEQLARLFHP